MRLWKKSIPLWATLLIAVVVSGALGASMVFVFTRVPFEPTGYDWEAPWEVYVVVDFIEAKLNITGSGYGNQNHDVLLIVKNIAVESDYVLLSFDYLATWTVGSDFENIIAGSWSDTLAVDLETEITDIYVPTIAGIGKVGLNLTNIVWGQTKSISWTTEVTREGSEEFESFEIENFIVTGASMSYLETGTVSFDVNSYLGASMEFEAHLKIVELDQAVGPTNIHEIIPTNGLTHLSFDFGPLTEGGDLTMQLIITRACHA